MNQIKAKQIGPFNIDQVTADWLMNQEKPDIILTAALIEYRCSRSLIKAMEIKKAIKHLEGILEGLPT